MIEKGCFIVATEKAIEMIDEYLLEPNSISKEWIECMRLCKQAILDSESQKAEIERLQKEGLILNKTFMDFVNKKKAETIKEFADRLEYFALHEDPEINAMKCKDYESYMGGFNQFRLQIVKGIDNLLKEMEQSEAE